METIINDFLDNEMTKNAFISKINETNILEHYSSRTGNLDMTILVKEMIEKVLLKFKINDDFNEDTLNLWINEIIKNKETMFDDFIYSFIDTEYDDIIEFNHCFQSFIYVSKDDKPEDMQKILRKAQYYGYHSFLDFFAFLFTFYIKMEYTTKD